MCEMSWVDKVLYAALAVEVLFIILNVLGIIIIKPVVGRSMYPTIDEGDIILCIKFPYYTVGDIVVYRPRWINGTYIVHRIIYIDDAGFYYLKGDNPITNPVMDYYPATKGDILCKVVWHS